MQALPAAVDVGADSSMTLLELRFSKVKCILFRLALSKLISNHIFWLKYHVKSIIVITWSLTGLAAPKQGEYDNRVEQRGKEE